ncbi:MAG: hypothetical protein ACXVJJ_05570 [Halobacteriota archaeon]
MRAYMLIELNDALRLNISKAVSQPALNATNLYCYSVRDNQRYRTVERNGFPLDKYKHIK